uniref:Innexin n=1 Tax=Caenorhabditis japonica TaxID=281687 RepID=A0A8R1DUP9_CAEJA
MFVIPFLDGLTKHLNATDLDDASDSLSCLFTAAIFIVSAILISAKANVGSTIECWLPQTYSSDWGQFSENYCFLKDTYWYPNHEPMHDIPESHKEAHRLSYYQWSSMYLAVCGLIFMIPKFLWNGAHKSTDMPLDYFTKGTKSIKEKNYDDRKEKVKEMADFMRNKVTATHGKYSMASVPMVFVYVFIKLLYVVIAFLQFIGLSVFLGQKGNLQWGWTLFVNLINGVTWETTGMFPRVTFCDFTIREMAGNNRDETVQCVIGINEFNEKIFLFLWFWLVFLMFAVSLSTLYTCYQMSKAHFVTNLLHSILDKEKAAERMELKADFLKFSEEYLTFDGKIILSFIKAQSDMIAQEVAVEMFRQFKKEQDGEQDEEDYNDGKQILERNEKLNEMLMAKLPV